MGKRLWKIGPLPVYALIIGIAYAFLQAGLYVLAVFLSRRIGSSAWAFIPKIPAIDNLFPIVPIFVVIYLFSFIFWPIGTAVVSLTGKKNFFNYLISLTCAYYLTFLILLYLPTYLDRASEGILDYAGKTGLINSLFALVYRVDGGDYGYNLLPSYHCLSSILCYLGIHKRPEIPRGYRIYTLIMAILICFSTLFTKQHYFMDVISAICVSIPCFLIVSKLDPGERIVQHFAAKKSTTSE